MAGPRIAQEQAQEFLADRFGTVSTVEFVGEGSWSRCFGFTHEDRELVIRFGAHRSDFEKDLEAGAWRREHLPIPEVLEIGDAFDGHYAISTRVRGVPLESLDTAGWQRVTPSLLRALHELHRIPVTGPSPFGADDLGRFPTWREYLLSVDRDGPGHRTHGWRTRLATSRQHRASFDRALHRLDQITSTFDVRPAILHTDLVNRNVFVRDAAVTGMLDWGCSFVGDFLYDVATIVFWTPWYPELEGVDLLSATLDHAGNSGEDLTGVDLRLEACALHIGLVHMAYNAFLGDADTLAIAAARTESYIGGAS